MDENLDAGVTLWTLTDQLGSVRGLVNADTGALVNKIIYDAFGNVVQESHPAAVDHLFGYTGREFDEETGLQYNRARYYDPLTGRFRAEDPSGFDGGRDMNLYRYVGNHPTLLVDPTGLRAQTKRLTGGYSPFDPEANLLASLDTSWLLRAEREPSVATILPEMFAVPPLVRNGPEPQRTPPPRPGDNLRLARDVSDLGAGMTIDMIAQARGTRGPLQSFDPYLWPFALQREFLYSGASRTSTALDQEKSVATAIHDGFGSALFSMIPVVGSAELAIGGQDIDDRGGGGIINLSTGQRRIHGGLATFEGVTLGFGTVYSKPTTEITKITLRRHVLRNILESQSARASGQRGIAFFARETTQGDGKGDGGLFLRPYNSTPPGKDPRPLFCPVPSVQLLLKSLVTFIFAEWSFLFVLAFFARKVSSAVSAAAEALANCLTSRAASS